MCIMKLSKEDQRGIYFSTIIWLCFFDELSAANEYFIKTNKTVVQNEVFKHSVFSIQAFSV